MRFFVPTANDPRQAEEVYNQMRNKVAASGHSIIDKRIYRLKYEYEGGRETVVVGSDRHRFGTGLVVAIFADADGTHYVCTQPTLATEAEPHSLPQSAVIDTEDFSALA